MIYPFVVWLFGFVRFVWEIRTQAGIPLDDITASFWRVGIDSLPGGGGCRLAAFPLPFIERLRGHGVGSLACHAYRPHFTPAWKPSTCRMIPCSTSRSRNLLADVMACPVRSARLRIDRGKAECPFSADPRAQPRMIRNLSCWACRFTDS